ncbi:DMT family transporter [Parasedimentitalea maritima]|uniref:DMT family transporter n=1 Tax=Parasedimentitalea maritima TaxID=2578117 RepID=A0ABY2UZJ2_9RHOB|nr:DMT family transporter [Zongyanglinia marina]TLP68881.1 DMT family transporter [Zongyanglinia marina]
MNLKAAVLALLGYAIFSTHDVVVKYLGASMSPFQLVFFSSLLSFPLVTLMLIRDPAHGNLRPQHPWWMALRSIAVSLVPASAFYAFSQLPLAQAYALLFVTPLLVTLLSIPVLKEQVGLPRMLAVVLGFIGVMVVLRPGGTEFGWGHAAALLAAFGNALQSVILRKIGTHERRVVLMIYPLMTTFVAMGIALPFVYVPLEASALGGLVVVAIFGFCATLLMVSAYTLGEAAIVAPMQYSQIIWATLFGFFLFGEAIDPSTLLGAGIIIGSGIFIVIREASGGQSRNTPVLQTRTRGYTSGGVNISLLLKRKSNK